ncbi:hypothetical protein [Paenibacillus sp. PvR148]
MIVTWAERNGYAVETLFIPERGALSSFDLLRIADCSSGLSDLWHCGDMIYPGADKLGSAMSGWIAAERIRND